MLIYLRIKFAGIDAVLNTLKKKHHIKNLHNSLKGIEKLIQFMEPIPMQ